jgi:GNAT superfamily N-acetyltransferase
MRILSTGTAVMERVGSSHTEEAHSRSAAKLSVQDLQEMLARAKAGSKQFVTNFFLAPAQWPACLEHGLGILVAHEQMLLLCWPEEACERIYFAGERAVLASELSAIQGRNILASDVVGRANDTEALSAAFKSAGFRVHGKVLRLCAAKELNIAGLQWKGESCRAAGLQDIPDLVNLLQQNFEPLAEPLPARLVMEDAIRAGEIRLMNAEGRLAGLVWFSRTGATSLVRFWCVAADFRGEGLGSVLMRDYLEQTRGCARHLIWVREDNASAKAAYEHYGYKADGLEDLVMVR